MTRIDVFLPNLRFGGAERVLVRLAEAWDAAGHDVRFVLARREGELLEGLRLPVVDLGAPRVVRSVLPLARHLRGDPPDVLLSSLTNANLAALLAARLSRYRGVLLVRQAGHPVRRRYQGRVVRTVIRVLSRLLYPGADAVVCVSEGVRLAVGRVAPGARCVVVPNPVDAEGLEARASALRAGGRRPGPDRVVMVTRLDPVKRLDVALAAFERVRRERPARLTIVGAGPERGRAEALARDLGVADDVEFTGFQQDVVPYLVEADVLLSSSDFEGWPNALMEALACGTPVVATDCPSGPREILDGGRFGRLVPTGDVGGLAQALSEALDEGRRDDLPARARAFDTRHVAERYLDVARDSQGG